MTTGSDIVIQARTWLGTPFKHQGRRKGVGVDCVGLVIGVAHELSLTDFDFRAYGRLPHAGTLLRYLRELLIEIPMPDRQDGDVLVFAFPVEAQHVGIQSDLGIIHSHASAGQCVEHHLGNDMLRNLRHAFRFKGLT